MSVDPRFLCAAGRCATLLLSLLSLGGCDAPEPTHESRVIPYDSVGIPWIYTAEGDRYFVDTGMPRSFVVPRLAGLPEGSFGPRVLERWSVFGIGAQTEVVVNGEFPMPVAGVVDQYFGGIIGAEALARQPFMFDPYRGRFILDDDGDFSEWLAETEDPVHVPVEVRGGGVTCFDEDRCFDHPGLRMLVEVMVEGEPVTALLDTGSTYTSMGESLFARLEAKSPDPHPRLSLSSRDGVRAFSRLSEMSIGAATLEDVAIRVDTRFDTALARLSVETNRRVELLLGHSTLLYYAVGVDYEAERLTLARYTQVDSISTESFEDFGLWVENGVDYFGCFPVVMVTDHPALIAAGIEVGDCVTRYDHVAAKTMTLGEVERLMDGKEPGESVELGIVDGLPDPAAADALAVALPERSVSLRKLDFLPDTQR